MIQSSRVLKFLLSLIILINLNYLLRAQTVYGFGNGIMYKIEIDLYSCDEGCSVNSIGSTFCVSDGASFCPNGNMYGMSGSVIYQIDTITGACTQLFFDPPGQLMEGFACLQDSTFYSLDTEGNLYLYNINNNTAILVGSTGFDLYEGLTILNGEYYFPTPEGIVHLDPINPENSTYVVSWPIGDYIIASGMTASILCNTLIAINALEPELVTINIIEGSIEHLCHIPSDLWYLASNTEYNGQFECQVSLDLDCNDSSGASDADFNSLEFDCLSDGVIIADEDIKIQIDAIITEMRVEITGTIPNGLNEVLIMSGSVPAINANGSGTSMITLTNAGGAKMQDFKDALHLILYDNTSAFPIAGLRTVEVQFTTESGMMSNVATAFIQVNELPPIFIDLGPDYDGCEGESILLDAGNPGSDYVWSTGQTSQTITVDESGTYIVTVSDGTNCPNQDTIVIELLPLVHVFLEPDTEICDDEDATITIHTDSQYPITVTVETNFDGTFTFTDVTGNYSFGDSPDITTEYSITEVLTSELSCIDITESMQVIFVYPTFDHNIPIGICEGDSVLIGSFWVTDSGTYTIQLFTGEGCDSTIHYNVSFLPSFNVSQQQFTCDTSAVGIFITEINNPSGCDTIIETTVSLLPSDTTMISSSSCNSGSTGIFTQVLANQSGCDSIIITIVSLLPPADTIHLFQSTCDSSQLGVYQQILSDQTGCDSLVITTISAGVPDTSYLSTTSCDSASLGVFEDHFISQSGCDSTLFTTVTYSASDSSFINTASCNLADTGVFVQNLINRFGCDSIVTEIISLLPTDQTFITSNTCDPAQAGVILTTLTNQSGCDSVITETIELLPSDATNLFSSTCISSQSGVFVTDLINQYGCDSIITLTVSLVAADTSLISFKTCDPAQVGSTEELFTGQDGCDSLVISETSLYLLPVLNAVVSSEYNGYAISCFGESDGSAVANVTGTAPFIYIWSTGSTDPGIANVPEGLYAVTITDGNGCTTNSEVILIAPPEFSISLVVSQPDCFDQDKGSISVQQIGGIEPIRYSIDGINYQPSPVFNDLSGGTYQISVLDANDCEVKEIIWINVPLMVHVDLGDDLLILPGDTTIIEAIVNVPFDSLASITWSGLINPNCPDCLTQPVAPIITTTYSVTVTSNDGCADKDAMTLYVDKENDIYVPNIFSPNGDNVNDRLLISAGKDVERISSFIVFDRWGDMVFSANDFFPNDAGVAWDGKVKGRFLNPGVFAYRLIAVHNDGSSTFRYGDVTLLR